jgi:hypothetical protein
VSGSWGCNLHQWVLRQGLVEGRSLGVYFEGCILSLSPTSCCPKMSISLLPMNHVLPHHSPKGSGARKPWTRGKQTFSLLSRCSQVFITAMEKLTDNHQSSGGSVAHQWTWRGVACTPVWLHEEYAQLWHTRGCSKHAQGRGAVEACAVCIPLCLL